MKTQKEILPLSGCCSVRAKLELLSLGFVIHMAPTMLGPTPQSLVFTAKALELLPARSGKPSRDNRESQGNPLATKKIDQFGKSFSDHTNVVSPKKNGDPVALSKFSCSLFQTPVQKMLYVKRYLLV